MKLQSVIGLLIKLGYEMPLGAGVKVDLIIPYSICVQMKEKEEKELSTPYQGHLCD